MRYNTYYVGGFVRDSLMGIKNKDIDYAVEAPSFDALRDYVVSMGGQIFLEKPEFVTIRARVGKETADYVLCRKDGTYSDARRPDYVTIGSIYDDLARRDFTMNSIAQNVETGEIVDPFGGQADIKDGLIRCTGSAHLRMHEDSLRLIRAARFSITKGMAIHHSIVSMFNDREWMSRLKSVSEDRIREEVYKMFACNTQEAIEFFGNFPLFSEACFSYGIWLKPTSEKP